MITRNPGREAMPAPVAPSSSTPAPGRPEAARRGDGRGDGGARGPGREVPPWQREMAGAVQNLGELLRLLELEAADLPGPFAEALAAARDFPLRVPHAFVRRMRRGDPNDPLLLQVLPLAAEKAVPDLGWSRDPLDEAAAAALPGLLHKYRGRALLVLTGACAVHCRYCFRRHFPYSDQRPDWQRVLDYLAADPSIEEVLLSGGDPLSLSDEKLASLTGDLARIPHLRRLRVHSRLPIVLPSRVDEALLSWLTAGERWQPVLVVHANHAREIDAEVKAAVSRLRGAGVTVLNQSVLLRRVNDDIESLVNLSQALFASGILPYYLNLLDRVEGAGHFEVEEDTARDLSRALLQRLPGYLVPKLVRDVPGAPSKVSIPILDL